MATPNINHQCSMCNKQNGTYLCSECNRWFCFNHVTEHRKKTKEEFHAIEHTYNQFRQNIIDKKNHTDQHSLINKINEWEKNSIEKIRRRAAEYRRRISVHLNQYIIYIENQSKDLFEQLKQYSKDDGYNERDLNQCKYKLNKLQEELNKSENFSVEEGTSAEFINKMDVLMSTMNKETRWKPDAITVAGVNGKGSQLNQLHNPFSICIDKDQTLYIADFDNHRIIAWKLNATDGKIIVGGNGSGNRINQLYHPTNVIINQKKNSLIISDYGNRRVMEWSLQNNTNNGEVIIENIACCGIVIDKNGNIYVSDYEKHQVMRWNRDEREGRVVAGGHGQGDQLDQLNYPTHIFVSDDLSLYVSDQNNHRVMKWLKDAKEGIVVAGGNGQGNRLTQLSLPDGLVVDDFGQIYVSDWENGRIMCWYEGAGKGSIVVGENGQEDQSNQVNHPGGLSFDQHGNLYVSDIWNHRIQKFDIY